MNRDKKQRIYDEGRRDGFYAGVRAERMLSASQIVRCRDCKHISRDAYGGMRFCYRTEHEFIVEPDGFCAWGERRDA